MTKVLLLGGHGMAGHMILHYLSALNHFKIYYTIRPTDERKSTAIVTQLGWIDPQIVLDLTDFHSLTQTIQQLKPQVVINCSGILNEAAKSNLREAIYINSLLPHLLVELSKVWNYKLIHLSTDCVFSGERGNYTELDEPTGDSPYARTKILGEIRDSPHLTVRTSIIGPELKKMESDCSTGSPHKKI